MNRPQHVIAWDIETVPLPGTSYSERQARRVQLELDAHLSRKPDADVDDASRFVRSIHPMLGRICVLSLLRLDVATGAVGTPKSYVAALPGQEAILLGRFWADVAKLPRDGVCWVTFNGKRFDADWLRVRSAAHDIRPTRRDILDTYPFKHAPHCDLSRVFSCRHGLDDLCDLLGVESPKAAIDGSGVAAAVEAGKIAEVVSYCERDVVATLEVYRRLSPQL